MHSVQKGKKIVISIIVVMLLIDIITSAVTSSLIAESGRVDYASYKLVQGIFRFLLTGLILFFLYKGHKWAKWLIIILLLVGGVFSAISLVSMFSIVILAMAIVYIGISVILVSSSSVKNFLSYQKGEYYINEKPLEGENSPE